MANRSRTAQAVYDAALPHIEALGIDLVDVEMVKSGQKKILRLYIDKRGGVSLDDCTTVSQLIDPIVDQELKINEHDFFEVSSPGLDRPLKNDKDFARYQGEWVEVSLYKGIDGKKKFKGKLAPCTDQVICIEQEDETTMSFKREQVANVKRIIIL